MMTTNKNRGAFIVFEGVDGSGKSTHIHALARKLRAEGHVCYETREPTDGPVGSIVHQCMMGRVDADPHTIASLFAADRVDHVYNEYNGILKKVESGVTVLADRYVLSSLAYNGSEVSSDWIWQLNAHVLEVMPPDCTVFIDIDPALAMHRIDRREDKEKYETLQMLTRVRERYLDMLKSPQFCDKSIVISGNDEIDRVSDAIWRGLREKGVI